MPPLTFVCAVHPQEAVCVAFPAVLVVHGIHRGSFTYRFEYPFCLIQELDCVRILTSVSMEVLQILPEFIYKSRDLRSYKEPASQLMLATTDENYETVTGV